MRIFRIVGIVAGTLIALIVVGIVALFLFVDPNSYRGDIEKAAREHSTRVLTIHGKLELKVFPWLALSVHDVELSNRPGFGAQPFLTVQNASIGVKLLPLLSKRLEVSRVHLEGANINLVSRGGQNNWQDLGEESKAAPQKPSRDSGPGAAVSIEGVDVSKTSVVYNDELKKSTTELGNLELHTGRLETGPERTALEKVELQGSYWSHPSAAAAAVQQPGPGAAEVSKPLAFSLSATALATTRRIRSRPPRST